MSKLADQIKAFYRENPWQGRLIISFIIIALILTLIRISLPQTIIYSTTSWLKKQGIDSTIEAINIDILDGTVSLVNAKGTKNAAPLFNVGLIDIHWRWAPLSDKTVVVTKVVLDQFNVSIEHYTDNIIVGGVHIPLNTSASDNNTKADELKPKSEKVTPWAASLGEVLFTNLNICYLQHTAKYNQYDDNTKYIDYCVKLDEMTWGGTISYATDKSLLESKDLPLSSHGDFLLHGLTVVDNKLNKTLLSSVSNNLNNVTIKGLNNIHISQINMNGLSALQRDDKQHIDAVRFKQLTINNIQLNNLNSLDIKTVALSHPGLYLVKLKPDNWEYQRWLPHSSKPEVASNKSKDKQENTSTSAFKVAITNITVDDSDFCYLENEVSLYYCFTLENLKWDGSIKYGTLASTVDGLDLAASGSLSLTQPKIRNHTINRNFLDLKSLDLSNLNIVEGKNITLDTLSLNNLSALQRRKNNDDYTVSFTELTVSDASYTNNILAINTINLDGLASAVSKNKDGQWEHNKWLSQNTRQDNTSNTENNISTDDKKPLLVSLNKLNITSDKEILFTDNTTKPAMNAGLHNLSFNINKLQQTQPDADSPFKLKATTTRHSTVDIEGTVRPFADKVSVDATGKLKGFDLRAVTPVTKKTIGHIIKSGQMDADLQLRAVEGVLDSEIGLALYHFNIKPMSKADAQKLDKQFGMPLNQTLVLLRNKDGSIHLDIPITGDINNPEFNPMNAIIKATSKAATVTLVTFYTPYGLIYAGGNVLFDFATAMNFAPVQFTPGSSELLDNHKEQLDTLAKLMTEKPQIHLTLCGVTNQEDLYSLYPDMKNQQNNKTRVDVTLSTEQAAALTQLAQDRQSNSKDYLINAGKLEHDRLILCDPEHKTDDAAIAGVEINI